jgi:hypothetical protein
VAPDTGGIYPDGVLGFALDPRLHPGADDRRALGLGVQMMGSAPDQHRPPRARRQVDLVDLQGDVEFGVRDTVRRSSSVKVSRVVRKTIEPSCIVYSTGRAMGPYRLL